MSKQSASTVQTRLDGLLDELFSRKDVHSAVMSVASGDGAFKWTGARGNITPNGPAMTPSTPWVIASITKLFIATMIMRMVERGELALDDRVVDRLAPPLTHRLHVLGGTDWTDHITVEHLLSHTSGLADFIEDYPGRRQEVTTDRRSLVETLLEQGDRTWSLDDTVRRVRDCLTPHFAPQALNGSRVRVRYSDTNYQLLIGIIETRRDEPFNQVLNDLILEPLALRNTWVPGHARHDMPEPEVAAIYAGPDVVGLPKFLGSIGDLNSTCEDLLGFYKALVDGGLFQHADSWQRMQAWHRFSLPLDRAAIRQPSWPIQYGLGVMQFQLPRLFTPFQPMPEVLGHTGSTGTWLFYAPNLDLYLTGAASQATAGAVPFKWVPKILRTMGMERTPNLRTV